MRDRIPSAANEVPRVGHFVFSSRGSLHTRPPILKWFQADSADSPQGRIAVPNTILLRHTAISPRGISSGWRGALPSQPFSVALIGDGASEDQILADYPYLKGESGPPAVSLCPPVYCPACRNVLDIRLGFFLSREHVKEKGVSQNVTDVFQLGRSSLSRGLSKSVFEHSPPRQDSDSPPSLEAAHPADCD